MNKYAMSIALILFFYGNCSYKIAMLRKTLELEWKYYMLEAIVILIASIFIACFSL